MKPKSLIKFVQSNAYEIKSESDPFEKKMLMSSQLTCVLRPLKLPRFVKILMTQKEKDEYQAKSCQFCQAYDIDDAVKWVKDWVSK